MPLQRTKRLKRPTRKNIRRTKKRLRGRIKARRRKTKRTEAAAAAVAATISTGIRKTKKGGEVQALQRKTRRRGRKRKSGKATTWDNNRPCVRRIWFIKIIPQASGTGQKNDG